MHEVIGHGSGKLGPKVTREPAYYIKEYYSTLEEVARGPDGAMEFLGPEADTNGRDAE